MRRELVAGLVLAGTVVLSARARADEGEWELDLDIDEGIYGFGIAVIVAPPVGLLGGVAAIGTGVTLDDKPPPPHWRTFAYAMAVLNAAVGTTLVVFALTTDSASEANAGVGVASLAVGGLDLGLAVAASGAADDVRKRGLSAWVAPTVCADVAGSFAPGALLATRF